MNTADPDVTTTRHGVPPLADWTPSTPARRRLHCVTSTGEWEIFETVAPEFRHQQKYTLWRKVAGKAKGYTYGHAPTMEECRYSAITHEAMQGVRR